MRSRIPVDDWRSDDEPLEDELGDDPEEQRDELDDMPGAQLYKARQLFKLLVSAAIDLPMRILSCHHAGSAKPCYL